MVLRRAVAECPKKVAGLVDLVNLPTALREFAGCRSQMSHLSFFLRVWSHIKEHNLQLGALRTLWVVDAERWLLRMHDPTNKNIVNCDEKLKTVLLGRSQVQLFELPMIVKLHFPKVPKS
ncbi:uncharacterized protein LOC112898798 isoform X1 [Panicum hallii]|uniref:uncharacterized protein LOC112898798 isoform X1 n=1 Tax=Panicum hallii TaxID=206008 RepID=UPI000DF4CFDF|nr:uncharacterized protein LOC112898798 isoform X1 [Panicum hallii]